MKRYWKIVLALAIIFTAGGGIGYTVGNGSRSGWRTPPSRPEGWAVMMMERMSRGLNLTDEQRAEIQPNLRETGAKLYQIRRSATREQAMAIRDFYTKVEPILTEEQRQQLLKSRQEVRERIERMQNGENGPHPLLPRRPQ